MGEPVLCFPNYLDVTFYNVVMGGGSWLSTRPLTNLKLDALSKQAQASTANDEDNKFFLDLGNSRGIRAWAFPYHNFTLSATHRVRGSDTPKFTGATVNSDRTAGNTSFTLLAGSSAVNITAGEIFTFANHSTVYKATSDVAISAAGTGTVNVSPALTANLVATEVITCHSGDFSTPLYDTGTVPVFDTIYPFGSIDYTHPSWWTGLPTEEQRQSKKFPLLDVFDLVVARYWYFEFFDTVAAQLPRLHISPGYQPSTGIAYDARHDWVTNTRVDNTLGGRRIYGVEPTARTLIFQVQDLTVDEALSNMFDLSLEAAIHKQLFFIFDEDDTALMHRRAFLATFERPSPLSYPYFNRIHTAMEIREVVA